MAANSDVALVTGATGFVGSAVARVVAAKGLALRVLARPGRDHPNLEGLQADVVMGDMRDPQATAQAMAGARFLFHVAADYRIWAPDPQEIVRNNTEGTEIVMRAALAAGVERVVYTSSVAAIGLQRTPADETCRLQPRDAVGAYKLSKLLAEQVVDRLVADEGLKAVIVNPSTPIGPRDVRPTPTGRIIVEAAAGRMPAYVDTGLNLVHVDDVAEGHWLALQKGRIGERYILGGQDASLRELLAAIARLTGRRPPKLELSRAPLYPLALLAEAAARITGKEPMLTVDALKMSKKRMFFSSAKAARELGYAARPYQEGLKDALDWFGAHGHV